MRRQVIGLFALLLTFNIAVWSMAWLLFHGHPVQFGAAFLAYGFGLRHAVDADHIAAIDNATRKLLLQRRRPADVGLFFSLGHSTIVVALSFVLALTAHAIQARMSAVASIGGIIGAGVSTAFLLILAAINLAVFASVWRTYRTVRAGGAYDEEDLELLLARRGPMGRLFRGLFRLVGRSWHMYLVGLLFGLGFDTATEIGILGLSAATATHATSLWWIMIYPALFTAGMTLVDTTDSVLMTGAYRWALADPVRKLRYNLVVTGLSAATAIGVGGIEAASVVRDRLGMVGPGWRVVGAAADRLGVAGVGIILLMLACWMVATFVYRARDRRPLALG